MSLQGDTLPDGLSPRLGSHPPRTIAQQLAEELIQASLVWATGDDEALHMLEESVRWIQHDIDVIRARGDTR